MGHELEQDITKVFGTERKIDGLDKHPMLLFHMSIDYLDYDEYHMKSWSSRLESCSNSSQDVHVLVGCIVHIASTIKILLLD